MSRTHPAQLFWSRSERRLRSLWRLLIVTIVGLFGTGLFQRLALLPIAVLLMLTAQLPFSAMGDGEELILGLNRAFANLPLLAGLRALIVLAIVAFVFIVVARWIDRRPWQDFGFHFNRAWWRDLGFGAFLGLALIGLLFVVEYAMGWVSVKGLFENGQPELPFAQLLAAGFLWYVLVGVQEEVFVRGYLLQNLGEGLHSRQISPRAAVIVAYLVTSLLFGVLHATNAHATLGSSLSLAVAGLFLGLGFILTGELAIPIGLHITWNFAQGYVFGFPVSGYDQQLSLIAMQQDGPALWTGGEFGPEAGLMGLLAVLLGMLLIFGWVRWTRGAVSVQAELAQYVPGQQDLASASSNRVRGEVRREEEPPQPATP